MSLKRLTIWLLLFALFTANLSAIFVYTGFKLNQQYITSTLCENRDKPWMHCNGQCYLMKKYKQALAKERNGSRQSQKSQLQQTFFSTIAPTQFHSRLLQVISTPYHLKVPLLVNQTVFHPPKIA